VPKVSLYLSVKREDEDRDGGGLRMLVPGFIMRETCSRKRETRGKEDGRGGRHEETK
jgi:hypothetical protein